MATLLKNVLLKDVAKEAGVSTALASFVLNGQGDKYRVSDDTAKHIKKIAAKMKYTPNMAARSLRSGKTGIIGVVVSDISNPFFAQIARQIEDVAERLGYTVFFGSSDEKADKMQSVIAGLVSRHVDGLIIVPCQDSTLIINQLAERQTPVVLLDRPCEGVNISSVTLNNFSACYEATAHLIQNGYDKVGILAYDTTLFHMRERIRGYRSAMCDKGLENNISVGYIDAAAPRESAAEVMDRMLAEGVNAFFCATNTISIACLHYINAKHLDIPNQYGVVGFDGDSDAFDVFYAPLSYIVQPIDKLAQKAVDMLIELLSDSDALKQQVMINGELVIRQSSDKGGVK